MLCGATATRAQSCCSSRAARARPQNCCWRASQGTRCCMCASTACAWRTAHASAHAHACTLCRCALRLPLPALSSALKASCLPSNRGTADRWPYIRQAHVSPPASPPARKRATLCGIVEPALAQSAVPALLLRVGHLGPGLLHAGVHARRRSHPWAHAVGSACVEHIADTAAGAWRDCHAAQAALHTIRQAEGLREAGGTGCGERLAVRRHRVQRNRWPLGGQPPPHARWMGRRRGELGAAECKQLIEGALVVRLLTRRDPAQQREDGCRTLQGGLVDLVRAAQPPHLGGGHHPELGGARTLPPGAEIARDEEELGAEQVRRGGRLDLVRGILDAYAAADIPSREPRQEWQRPSSNAHPFWGRGDAFGRQRPRVLHVKGRGWSRRPQREQHAATVLGRARLEGGFGQVRPARRTRIHLFSRGCKVSVTRCAGQADVEVSPAGARLCDHVPARHLPRPQRPSTCRCRLSRSGSWTWGRISAAFKADYLLRSGRKVRGGRPNGRRARRALRPFPQRAAVPLPWPGLSTFTAFARRDHAPLAAVADSPQRSRLPAHGPAPRLALRPARSAPPPPLALLASAAASGAC